MKRISRSRCYQPRAQAFLPIVLLICFVSQLHAQSSSDPTKSLEALQSRIERARALVAAHQLQTAATELESVRVSTSDETIRNISSVLLMSVYLEEGNYTRAQALLEESFSSRAAKSDAIGSYFALAGQAVNAARTHLARYRSFGINTSDANLPIEVINDLDHLRSLLDRMIAQAKEVSATRRAFDSLSLLEDVLGIRLSLAKDVEDQAKWETEYASVREMMASSPTQIASLGGSNLQPAKTSSAAAPSANAIQPIPQTNTSAKKTETATTARLPVQDKAGDIATPTQRKTEKVEPSTSQPEEAQDLSPIETGSLNAKAKKRVVPRYPVPARQSRTEGLVRVHVVVDETGKVIDVSRSEGPALLRRAAEDAARQWAFDIPDHGKPARYSGFIDFHFVL